MRDHHVSACTTGRALWRGMLTLGGAAACVLSVGVGSLHAQSSRAPNENSVGASSPALFSDWVARSLVVVAGDNFDDAMYLTPTGTGYDGIAALLVERTDGFFLCSGALLAGGTNVVTAAHCLADITGTNITLGVTAVFFPPNQPAGTREFVASSSTHVNPQFTGEIIDAHDIGVVSLATAPSAGILGSAYSLFTGNPFTTAQLAGSGATGTGETGLVRDGWFELTDRRHASNTIDFTWSNPAFDGFFINRFGFADPTTLVADFDNGLDANNSGCIITAIFFLNPVCGLGLGTAEGIIGPGDSGGPLFINGQIAGVASYGLSFGSDIGDTDDELNGTFGEFTGWTSTEYNAQWLSQYVTTVPEPQSLALTAMGLLTLAVFARRRSVRR